MYINWCCRKIFTITILFTSLFLIATTFAYANFNQYLNPYLILAVNKADITELYSLISSGANVNLRDKHSQTPLILASSRGHKKVAQVLITRGADVNIQTNDGWTALMWAAKKGHTGIVKMLLNVGADIKTTNKYKKTALMYAKDEKHIEIVKLLESLKNKLPLSTKKQEEQLQQARQITISPIIWDVMIFVGCEIIFIWFILLVINGRRISIKNSISETEVIQKIIKIHEPYKKVFIKPSAMTKKDIPSTRNSKLLTKRLGFLNKRIKEENELVKESQEFLENRAKNQLYKEVYNKLKSKGI